MSKFPLYFTVDMKAGRERLAHHAGRGHAGHATTPPARWTCCCPIDGTNYTTIVAAHKPVSPMTGATDTSCSRATPARYIQLKATMTIKQVSNVARRSLLGDRRDERLPVTRSAR